MAKKKITVKDVLSLMDKEEEVVVVIYAYGFHYADTWRDGMKTVEECLDQMNYTCISAPVTNISKGHMLEDTNHQFIKIMAELMN